VLGAHGKVVEARTERVFKASELRRRRRVRTPAAAVAAACSICPMTNNLP
jgi:hypothetical protein